MRRSSSGLKLHSKLREELKPKGSRLNQIFPRSDFFSFRITLILGIFLFFLIASILGFVIWMIGGNDSKTEQGKALVKQKFTEPMEIKGVYVHAYTAASPEFENIISLVEETELNAVIIDFKTFEGEIAFDSEVPLANEAGLENPVIQDMGDIVRRLHDKNIYAIARISVFQDDAFATHVPDAAVKNRKTGGVWDDYKGLSWADPSNPKAWAYNTALAKEAVRLGFDEVNFDYIRFPSDGSINDMVFSNWDPQTPKYELIRSFLEYLSGELRPTGIFISVDVFGLTTVKDDDLNIGQRIVDFVPYVDYISPMVYPSHYPDYFMRFPNPSENPYEVVFASMAGAYRKVVTHPDYNPAEKRHARLRPWLQDFNLGAEYGSREVRAQIQASNDAHSLGWMLWNANNRYTKGALHGGDAPTSSVRD